MMEFYCQNCGALQSAEPERAGESVYCTACGKATPTPQAPSLSEPSPPLPKSKPATSDGSPNVHPIVVVGVILFAIVAATIWALGQHKERSKPSGDTSSRSSTSSVFVPRRGEEYIATKWIYVYPTKEMPVSKEEMSLIAMTTIKTGDEVRVLGIDWGVVKIRLIKHNTHLNQTGYLPREFLKTYFRKRP